VCQQNFKKLAPRRNGLAEKLISEKEQKKTYQEQVEANWNEGKESCFNTNKMQNANCNFKRVPQSLHLS
jgi:hypothetical protein